ncbi:hypothetical protein [Myxacorys almedinensis]|uniref:Uncharacterized protein n=1 Tax=Myxacorys almedinensis A TaxID=2690445 RepID=A0A8J7Z203_9CYAN|nr:hypothetical protein [Myxacorys almedinensis]NDJ16711.1 hypothetical protein [Myxacorys almedinensis A]
MVGSLEQITQNLAALDRTVEELQEKFHSAYASYLKTLGQVTRQQLILSCHHICTEGYPQAFLALSLSHRQQLQAALRDLAKQSEHDLLDTLTLADEETEIQDDDTLNELDEELEFTLSDDDLELLSHDAEIEELELEDENELEALLSKAISSSTEQPPLTPIDLLGQWQSTVERSIVRTLQITSQAANQLLQQHEILPKQVPPPILEAAAKAKGNEPSSGHPNLLNLLIDASEKSMRSKKPDPASMVHVIAVNLRLAEIEFNDMSVTSDRAKLRALRKQFQSLAQQYRKKQRDYAIAEARLAWKSTWVNE